MKRIIRVFPRRTEMTPMDEMAFSRKFSRNGKGNNGDLPGMFIPDHDEVHICCVFTWDRQRAEYVRECWREKTKNPVLLDGPAYGNSGGDFIPGRYVRPGVTFTSKGCPNRCRWGSMRCLVPEREGPLRELPIYEGNIMNANNFLAETKPHRCEGYDMLKTQKAIEFKGGLEAARVTDWDIEEMRGLRIRKLFFAADSDASIPLIKKTAERFRKAGFGLDKLHCYVLIGDDMEKNVARCKEVAFAGMLPHAQLYQPEEWIEYSEEWKKIWRYWQRPAIYCDDLGLRAKLKEDSDRDHM